MSVMIWFLSLISWIVGSCIFGRVIFWIGLGIVPLFAILLIYFDLAPKDMLFTFVEEGTAKIIVRGGEFRKILISWKDYTIDEKTWDVTKEEGAGIGLFGGLRFYGIPPYQQIFSYHQRWTHLHENGDIKQHAEDLDYVLLKPERP